jgi:tetratricopeptide (TPR) repeat protein
VLDPLLEREPENTQGLLLRAYSRAQTRQDYAGSLADADAALAVDPKSSDGLVIRAVALLGLDRIDEAGEAITAASEHFDEAGLGLAESPRFCVVRATFAKEKKELERAEEIFEACLDDDPTNFTVVDESVKFFDGIGKPARALEILRAAFEGVPDFRTYRLSLANRLALTGEEEEAEELMRDATNVPQPAPAAIAFADLAGFYFERDRVDESISAFEEALARVPDPGAEFFFAYADALVVGGRYEQALAIAEKMTVVPHRELVRGRVALAKGDPATALEHFTEGLKLWPANAVARYFAASAAEELGLIDRAIEEYRYSIRADASATDARLRLARLYMAAGDEAAALEVIRHDTERNSPGDFDHTLLELELMARLERTNLMPPRLLEAIRPPARWPLAISALARGKRAHGGPAAAAQIVLQADRLDLSAPVNAQALRGLIEDLVALDRFDEARALVGAALEAHPEAGIFHALRGRVLAATGARPTEVRAAYERALELSPDNALALLELARIEAASEGRTDEALALYARAAAADAADTRALRESVELSIGLERSAEAEVMLESLLERDPYDGAAALQLARLRLARANDVGDPATVALLRRAERFGEAAAARPILQRVEAGASASSS